MIDDFAYVNARVRGMKSALLDRNATEELLSAGDLEGVLAQLRLTAWGKALDSSLTGNETMAGVEAGLRAHLASVFSRLHRIAGGRARSLIDLVLGHWEKKCVKSVLRGKARGASADDILASCYPAGMMDEPALRELSSLEGIDEVTALLVLWGYPPARAMRRERRRRPGALELPSLERALEQACVDHASLVLAESGDAGEGLSRFFSLQVDLENLLLLLRLTAARAGAEGIVPLFLRGGRSLSVATFTSLAGESDPGRIVESLAGSPPGEALQEALPAYRASGRLSLFEKAAHRRLLAESRRLALHDPLGVGLCAGFIWAKVNEAMNLRLLCRSRYAFLPREILHEEVSLPWN